MNESSDVVVVGAGPYGLSIATHLKALGLSVRTFGTPMRTWREHMPAGMYLKSDGFASNLSDPGSTFTLRHYCDQKGIAYDDTRVPVLLRTFQSYGLAFQERFLPELDEREVVGVDMDPDGYSVQLQDGETVHARRVILAVGISHFEYTPPQLAELPPEFSSHAARHSNVEAFNGRNVTVVGAGASASDLAALLYRAGATVQLVARSQILKFGHPPGDKPRSLWQSIRHPKSGLGPGLRSRFYTDAPLAFYRLPESLRLKLVGKHLGASGGYTVKEVVMQKVRLLLGHSIEAAEARGGKLHLKLANAAGETVELETDHVISATGYHPDLRRLNFLSDAIRMKIVTVDNTPILSTSFESSVPGLYFTGLSAANCFGPMLRFAYGADFTARRLARHFRKFARSGRQSVKTVAQDVVASEPVLETVSSKQAMPAPK